MWTRSSTRRRRSSCSRCRSRRRALHRWSRWPFHRRARRHGKALALGVAAVVGIERQDADWWPLLGLKAAVVLWAVVIARRRRSPGVEAVAVTLVAGGSVTFGVLADSPVSAVAGVAAWPSRSAPGSPGCTEAGRHLLDQPARVGFEVVPRHHERGRPLGGRRRDRSTWPGPSGTPPRPHPLDAGDPVVVVGFTGSTLQVAPKVPHPTT